ncbi:S-layer homology domain-containing protein [Marinicrinis lubricantis]|uniref:S-layer homology domain-containing protein n=1 Tax=Marinicrinis lubricantis TaxID=2086470 RepID=A0ABW1ISL4_9BACL
MKLVKSRRIRQWCAVSLALILLFSSVPFAGAEGISSEGKILYDSTDFENEDVWGFVPGGGASADVIEEAGGNSYLSASGSGSGNRSIVKALDEPTNAAEVLFTFDWKPEEVSTAANSSEIVFRDTSGTPIFRFVKEGGPQGQIRYGIGTTGIDLSQTQTVTGVTYGGTWLTTNILFDFNAETVSVTMQDKENPANRFEAAGIDFSALNYVNRIAEIAIGGNRASGQSLNFTTGLDNVSVYVSSEPAPAQGDKNIVSIVTDYRTHIQLPLNVTKEEVIALFPSTVDVKVENDAIVQGVGVSWDSADFDSTALGTYTFTGILNIEGIPNVSNELDIQAFSQVEIVDAGKAPVIPGYETVHYTDFGDMVAVVPVNWGFTTANSTLSIHTDELEGNLTPKLQYSQVNQSGGRVATKILDPAVKGLQILLKFDWYPGELNDKGSHPNENGGELTILDSSNHVIFTLNNTRNAPLRYYVGGKAETAVNTGFVDMNTWYSVEVNLDLGQNEAQLKITDPQTGQTESYTSTMGGVAFDGSVGSIKLVGLRTSGNNITWTTYLDNLGIYQEPISGDTIVTVDQLPYHRVYVGEASQAIDSIGLPENVAVTLADNSKAMIPVAEWVSVGKPWNAAEQGVYEFKGTLADTDGAVNTLGKTATIYVYHRLSPPQTARQTEWLDRGAIALKAEDGIFISWRLLADEYDQDITFNLYRNSQKLNVEPLHITNFLDADGSSGDTYTIETLQNGKAMDTYDVSALEDDYLSIPMQKPEDGTTATGEYTYSINDSSVGDLDGDGEYEVIVKWYPSNAIDSSQSGMTGPTIFDAYKLDGTLLWRMNMGLNLTSGAHYNQFIVADLDGDGKSEFLIKTADATTVYGTTDGVFDSSKVMSVIGNPDDDGKWVNDSGHVYGGPEYISVFNGETGEVIDTIDYVFALGDVASWGDTWHNRSDRFLAGLAYLDGEKPSAIYGRGYYERTTFAAYSLVDGKLVQEWTFDSAEEGRGGGLGYHSLATGDVDNDGFDEIVAGSLTLDQDGTILYMMDGEMGREQGSHGDALHVGAFDPDREGLHVFGVHEVPAVASLEYHDGATGETLMSFYASKDTGRGLAANITSHPGYEFWGTGGDQPETGGAIYNVQGHVVADSFRSASLPVNFALYWDGDLLQELLDQTTISKYNESTGKADMVREFEGVVSNNGTKATPALQADILGDWREEVLLGTTDSSELRVYSTTIPTDYRLYTLMHDTVYRMGIAWQNTAYNQPPHIGFYLGEDIRETVLHGELNAPLVSYTNKPELEEPEQPGGPDPEEPGNPDPEQPGGPDTEEPGSPSSPGGIYFPTIPSPAKPEISVREDGSTVIQTKGAWNDEAQQHEVKLDEDVLQNALEQAAEREDGKKRVRIEITEEAERISIQLPVSAVRSSADHEVILVSSLGEIVLPSNMLGHLELQVDDIMELIMNDAAAEEAEDRKAIELYIELNGERLEWRNANAPVTVSLPYEPSEIEEANDEFLVIQYIDEEGNRTPITNGRYVPDDSRMVFTTDHFSKFAVSYIHKTFGDLSAHGWAKHEIEVLASKGIIQGTSELSGTFSPEAQISRADFLILLVKALGLKAQADHSFADIRPTDYYYEAVGIAKKLGISYGDENALFHPRAEITRQDMIVLTARALEVSGYELGVPDESVLDRFKDQDDIADYALQAVSALVQKQLIVGSHDRMNPRGLATRAEAAVFLYGVYSMLFS